MTSTKFLTASLDAVLTHGAVTGLWQVLPNPYEEEHMARSRSVVTPNGLQWSLWLHDGKITCKPDSLSTKPKNRGIRAQPEDVRENYGDAVPSASVSADREPASNAKSLHKRVMLDPTAVGYAERTRALLAKRVQQRAELEGHVQTMLAAGFTFTSTRPGLQDDRECYEFTMYHRKVGDVRVNASGSVYYERITTDVMEAATLVSIAR